MKNPKLQNPNTKQISKSKNQIKNCLELDIWNLFGIWRLGFGISFFLEKRGITMLLVVAILSAIMAIGMGIFNVIFGQIRISGEIADSFLAFYAADQGIEKTLYLDRVTYVADTYGICRSTPGIPCYTELQTPASSGGCYDISVSKTTSPITTEIKVLGQYRCGANPNRIVRRGFNLTY